MPRGLDHIVHAVRDLEAGAEFYRRLGFTVGARNRHARAWGTENHIIQTSGTFIELLTVADTTGIAPHQPRMFSFGAFNRDFLAHDEGLSMLVLEGQGAADAQGFRRAEIGDFDLHHFEREGAKPDGSRTKVAFTLAFARDPKSPDIGFFTCQHHYPENFWNSESQRHANGAMSVAGIVMVAPNPMAHRDFIAAFTGVETRVSDEAVFADTPRGQVAVMSPSAYRIAFGVPAIDDSSRLSAVRFTVRSVASTRDVLRHAGIAHTASEKIVVPPTEAMGAAIVFEEAVKSA